MVRLFRHYIPKSLLVLAVLEVIILLLALILSVSLRLGLDNEILSELTFPQLAVFCFVILGTMISMGLYRRDAHNSKFDIVVRVVLAFTLATGFMILLFYIWPALFLGRGIMAIALACGFVGVVFVRLFLFDYFDAAFSHKRVIIIGTGKRAMCIEDVCKLTTLRSFEVVGYWSLKDESSMIDTRHILNVDSIKLLDLVKSKDVVEIIVAVDDRRKSLPINELLDCKMSGVEVIDLVTFLEKQTGKINVHEINPSGLIFADGYSHTVLKPVSKRLVDIVISVIILLVSLPVMMMAALAIWIESGCKGSVFYSQIRVGAGGRKFSIYKFRSMIIDAEKNGAQYAEEKDSRITKIGHFIRKSRIDELPQLINVLRGEMSFVGPRPERPEFVEQLKKKIPYYNLRHSLKPGITGWAQICYPYGANDEDSMQKLQFDLYYMKNYSIFLDLSVIFQTVSVILWRKGSR
ncbi:FIG071646: Sugar transferase [hydrothermal vent metagenome]|uniref:FIG071646: Sugar transferase n=1 Tax=hydrothermal vent metagenome TaxID=652676 RepID=A0A3B0ZGU1_9ZZZZ